jgi:FkbM family methyltransferase
MIPRAGRLFEKLPRVLRRHRLMKGWMRLTGEDPVQLVRIRDNAHGYADLSDGFLRLIVIDGDYEKDFFRVADALLQEGGEFLDVGANHGLLSFGLARKHDDRVRFHLFEPNPKLLEPIRKSLKLYPSMRAEINALAVCDEDGTILFHVQEDQTGASHIAKSGGIPIRSIKLDTYFKDKCLDHVELLKLDIEGYELPALRGAEHALRNRRIKAVYFEYFEKFLVRVAPPAKLIEFLDSLSYEICFCRHSDLERQVGTRKLTIQDGLPGHGLPLLPIRERRIPAMTDLLAIPRENLTGA